MTLQLSNIGPFTLLAVGQTINVIPSGQYAGPDQLGNLLLANYSGFVLGVMDSQRGPRLDLQAATANLYDPPEAGGSLTVVVKSGIQGGFPSLTGQVALDGGVILGAYPQTLVVPAASTPVVPFALVGSSTGSFTGATGTIALPVTLQANDIVALGAVSNGNPQLISGAGGAWTHTNTNPLLAVGLKCAAGATSISYTQGVANYNYVVMVFRPADANAVIATSGATAPGTSPGVTTMNLTVGGQALFLAFTLNLNQNGYPVITWANGLPNTNVAQYIDAVQGYNCTMDYQVTTSGVTNGTIATFGPGSMETAYAAVNPT